MFFYKSFVLFPHTFIGFGDTNKKVDFHSRTLACRTQGVQNLLHVRSNPFLNNTDF